MNSSQDRGATLPTQASKLVEWAALQLRQAQAAREKAAGRSARADALLGTHGFQDCVRLYIAG